MIREILAQHTWLWPPVWQSATVLAIGLGGSLVLRKRAVRAHQLLLLALIGALAVPALTHLVKQHQWGLLRSQPKAFEIDTHPVFAMDTPSHSERAAAPRTTGIAATTTDRPAFTQTASIRPIEWTSLVLPLWVVLSAALLVRLVIRFALGYRLARRSAPCETREIADAIERARTRLGVDSEVQLRYSAETQSPVIWCWGSGPILLVPAEASNNIDWDSVVCHELAHWKRRDHLSSLWAELMVCVLPWNPLNWLAQRRLVRLSEEACDDWVIASGQVGTRYARTLLGLTPQGHAALVPAVVSSKKGLATRIRRILTDQCSSPHCGRRWSLATAALAACLAVTIAFAQARPTQSTGTIRTTLGHGAVIEEPASSATLRGTVLDCNGNPVDDVRIIALPMTVYGTEIDAREEGRFEISWSPSWLKKDQRLYLIARGPGQQKYAAFVEVTDPTSPVTVHLQPAFSLKATVVDPDGQRVPTYAAILSLSAEFKCQAPVYATTVGVPRVELFSPIPFGPQYRLTIEADGYKSQSVTVDGSDRSTDGIDLGEITLQRTTSQDPIAVSHASDRDLKEAFLELYRLEDREVMKLVKAPFVLGRQEWLLTELPDYDLALSIGRGFQLRWGWTRELQQPLYGFSGRADIDSILRLMLVIPKHDYNLPKELDIRLPGGDWLVRTGSPLEDQMAALEEIILAETGRPIHFEKRRTEREVVVVRGRQPRPPVVGRDRRRASSRSRFADRDIREA